MRARGGRRLSPAQARPILLTPPLTPPPPLSPPSVLPRSLYPAWATSAFDWYLDTYGDPLVSSQAIFVRVMGLFHVPPFFSSFLSLSSHYTQNRWRPSPPGSKPWSGLS